MTTDAHPLPNRSLLKLVAAAVPVLLVLILVPGVVGTYQLQLVIYGLIAAIAALGFNLLLGYTGLLSFGHSAYFGVGAYSVAFVVKHLGPHSMEFYPWSGSRLSPSRRPCLVIFAFATRRSFSAS
jgi:branched-chain amino acid transport system permease protein